jgi:hypothetical protein
MPNKALERARERQSAEFIRQARIFSVRPHGFHSTFSARCAETSLRSGNALDDGFVPPQPQTYRGGLFNSYA